MDRIQRLEVQASQLPPRGRRTGGYLGWLLDLDGLGLRGGGVSWRVLAARADGGDGWVEAEWYFFIYLPHLVLSAILDVTYSVMSCTAPK